MSDLSAGPGDPQPLAAEDGRYIKHQWRDPRTAWRFVLAAYLVAIAIYVGMVATQGLIAALYARFISIPQEVATAIDTGVRYGSIAILPVFIACGLLTLWLTYRLAANAHSRGTRAGLAGPAMAAAYYVIPLVSLVMPPIVLGEIWKASTEMSMEKGGPRGLIALWWACFLGSSVSGAILNARLSDPEALGVNETVTLIPLNALSFGVRALAAITLLVIFATIVRRQRKQGAPAEVFA